MASTDAAVMQEPLKAGNAALGGENQGSKVKLYWLNKSRSQRILWLLEELNLQYDIETFKRGPDQLAPPELKKVHPLGKAPVISVQTGDGKPLVIAESALIIEYLTEHFGTWLVPERYVKGKEGQAGGETEEWLRYRFFMHYAEGSLMTYLIVSLIVKNIKTAPVPFFIRPVTNGIASKITSSFIAPNLKTHFTFLEEQLATSPNGGEWLCGDKITGADFLMSFPLESSRVEVGLNEDKYPKLCAYVSRIHAREGYKKAIQKIIEIEGEYNPKF